MVNETAGLLVGIELNSDVSQISYYDRKAKEAVSVPTKAGTNLYAFPTRLLKTEDGWHFGFEVEYFGSKKKGIPIRNLLEKAETGVSVTIRGVTYGPDDLLAAFLEGALGLLGLPDPVRSIACVSVTSRRMSGSLAHVIRKALRKIGFEDSACALPGPGESFFYYSYSQSPELWARGVMLLECGEENLRCLRLIENRARKPYAVTLEKIGEAALPQTSEERDLAFSRAAAEWTRGVRCSSIYITGNGFKADWAHRSVEVLRNAAEHVFTGENLFAKGACWAAVAKMERRSMSGRFFDGPDRVRVTLGIDVADRGKTGLLPLIRAGENWYNMEDRCEILLNGRTGLLFTAIPEEREKHTNIRMDLPGLPERPDRATRLLIVVRMSDRDHARITVEDLGFGELFPATHKKWIKDVVLPEPGV